MTSVVTLRPAQMDDGETIWRWRNAPDVRSASLNNEEIPLDVHIDWYQAALADQARTILMVMRGDISVGMIRLDYDGDTATINILIDASSRGAGVAKTALSQALAQSRASRFRALVKADNEASLALFRSLGFRAIEEGNPVVLER